MIKTNLQEIPTSFCPECERDWPDLSEQGQHVILYGHCYGCMVATINANLEPEREDANYVVEACSKCMGLDERESCSACATHGWVALPKD